MSWTRFKQFANVIRFDEKTTTSVHREKDNFQTIRKFNLFFGGLFGGVISSDYTLWQQTVGLKVDKK